MRKDDNFVQELKESISLKNRETEYFYERYIRDINKFSEIEGYILALFNYELAYSKNINTNLWRKAFIEKNIDSIKKIENNIKLYYKDFDSSIDEYLKIIDPKPLYLIHPLKISFLQENGIYELIVKYIDFFSFDFFNKNAQRGYKDLSSGERTLFSQFTNIFKTIYQYRFDNYLIILDEPDNRLHPQWQKEYINY